MDPARAPLEVARRKAYAKLTNALHLQALSPLLRYFRRASTRFWAWAKPPDSHLRPLTVAN